jgi:hypothetical protein
MYSRYGKYAAGLLGLVGAAGSAFGVYNAYKRSLEEDEEYQRFRQVYDDLEETIVKHPDGEALASPAVVEHFEIVKETDEKENANGIQFLRIPDERRYWYHGSRRELGYWYNHFADHVFNSPPSMEDVRKDMDSQFKKLSPQQQLRLKPYYDDNYNISYKSSVLSIRDILRATMAEQQRVHPKKPFKIILYTRYSSQVALYLICCDLIVESPFFAGFEKGLEKRCGWFQFVPSPFDFIYIDADVDLTQLQEMMCKSIINRAQTFLNQDVFIGIAAFNVGEDLRDVLSKKPFYIDRQRVKIMELPK